MKNEETILKSVRKHAWEASEVNAQPFNRIELKEPNIKWIKGTVRVLDECEKTKEQTKITGILTSNLRTRKSSDTPYMAFIRESNNNKHSLIECQTQQCKNCEIPVVFRIEQKVDWKKTKFYSKFDDEVNEWLDKKGAPPLKEWVKPNLSKGDKVILEGEFSPSKQSNRPSFTCYSYQILAK